MNRSRILFFGLALAALALPAASAAGTVAINEIVASNASGLADEDGDTEDWIELYNYGAEPVSLEGWGLSDDYDNPFRWVFPVGVVIGPEEFLLIWASGKDRDDPESELHTNFRIASAGEEVLLTAFSGERVDEIPPTEIPTDISYGRWPDGTGEWFFFDEPTPGASNSTTPYEEILDPPVFSHPGGFYTEEFELTLSHPDPEAIIVYTLDGSEPDIGNLEGTSYYYKNSYPREPGQPFGDFLVNVYRSLLYTDPLPVYDRSPEPDKLTQISSTSHYKPDYFPETPVRKGTVVRARAFHPGAIASPIGTKTYFVGTGNNPSELPVISIGLQEDAFFDYHDGIYVAGVDFDNWRENNPDDGSTSPMRPANYHRRGFEWEYPAHIELFPPGNSTAELKQNMGLRIHGSGSRSHTCKSLRLYARNLYRRSDFDYPFFPDLTYESYKRLILRTSGQDNRFTLFRDAVIQAMVSHLNFNTQAYQPSILFINGEYWGIHNIRERYDKHYVARVYGVDSENLDFLGNNAVVKEGDNLHYRAMLAYIADNGLSAAADYEYIQTQMDVVNFRDYQIAQIFAANTDWPVQNIDYWRLRTDGYQPDSLPGHDGRWRWLLIDTDWGFNQGFGAGRPDDNTLAYATAPDGGTGGQRNPPWSTFLLRKLLENESFQYQFINRFADLLNTTYLPERMIRLIDRFKRNIETEIPEHIHRWGRPSNWSESVGVMIDFADRRPAYQRQHIIDHFGLSGEVALELDVSNRWHGHIRVNTIEIRDGTPGIEGNPYPWTGIYFQGIPIELKAIPATGYEFSHWEGEVSSTDPVITVTPGDDLELRAQFTRSFESAAVYFWLFDTSLPNDTPLEEVAPTYSLGDGAALSFSSALEGYPFSPSHENWRKASLERRNAPTALNYRPEINSGVPYEETDMRGLQVRQPFVGDGGENKMVFHLPTEGFEEVVFSFAAKDEDAADSLRLDYSIAEVEDWITDGLSVAEPALESEYRLYSLDFSSIPEADDNPDFKVRLRFQGTDMTADEGNRVTFNNIALDGKPREGVNLPPEVVGAFGLQKLIEGGEELLLDLNEVFNDPDNDPLTFTASADNEQMVQLLVEGSDLTVVPLRRGGATITVTADDGYHSPVSTSFRVLIYPAAHRFGEYSFSAWDPDRPEYSYPPHMLFLQSDRDDPGLDDPLLYPYHIEHDDYHADDQGTIGFPYNNNGRTRINGLGEDGISFINTGRGRDLGGALLAIDTRGMTDSRINWEAETLLANERSYAIRLQYRVGIEGPFRDLLVDGRPVEYLTGPDGDQQSFRDIPLPPTALNQEYVQLLWRYYHVSGQSGPRAQLRLDDIVIPDLYGHNLIEGGDSLQLDLAEVFYEPDYGPLTFTASADNEEMVQLQVEGSELMVTPLRRGGATIILTADDGYHSPVSTSFRVLIYPAAHRFGEYSFTAWDPDQPEHSYPPHMLFLQSDRDDPGLDDPLLYPYFIEHDDYHADDEGTIGFPYNNTGRTRINGLGEDGISFINTGRGRDLGGALLAIDTRRMMEYRINWLAETLLANEQDYSIRLQYRVGVEGPFRDLLVDGEPVEYLTGPDGDRAVFSDILLPPEMLGREYVQLLWRYYHVSGERGPRAQLRLDDIVIPDPYCEKPLFVHRPLGMWIEQTRGGEAREAAYFLWSDEYTSVHDYENIFFENEDFYPIHYSDRNAVIYAAGDFVSRAGDRILLNYQAEAGGEELTRWVHLPSAEDFQQRADQHGWSAVWIGEDGSTYWDWELCQPAWRAPSPIPSPSVTPTVSPGPSSTPSISPTAPPPTATPFLTPPPAATPSVTPSPPPPGWIHDYDGDGTSDIAIFRPASGLWAVRELTRVYFGSDGDIPVPGDYDGDGTTDIAVFRGRTGLWAVRGLTRVYFGTEGDVPVPGDYLGEGTAGFAVYRESSGLWAVRGMTRVYFGTAGDLPVPGYYSGEGEKAIGVYRPGMGLWAVRGLTRVYFGMEGDIPVPGGYRGEGYWSPAVFRPVSGLWAVRGLTRIYFGSGGDLPVPGVYGGDGLDRMGVFRERADLWAVQGVTRVYFGTGGDLPVSR